MSGTFENDEFDIPLHITDFLDICKIYSQLGTYQTFIDELAENNEAPAVPINVLPNLIEFFDSIASNPYFGDAAITSKDYSDQLRKILKNYNAALN